MLPVERQQRISDILAENGIVLVSRLAEQFGVSELTIRRDLDQMEENRLLKRTHGGATILRNMNAEPDYLQKAAVELRKAMAFTGCRDLDHMDPSVSRRV